MDELSLFIARGLLVWNLYPRTPRITLWNQRCVKTHCYYQKWDTQDHMQIKHCHVLTFYFLPQQPTSLQRNSAGNVRNIMGPPKTSFQVDVCVTVFLSKFRLKKKKSSLKVSPIVSNSSMGVTCLSPEAKLLARCWKLLFYSCLMLKGCTTEEHIFLLSCAINSLFLLYIGS